MTETPPNLELKRFVQDNLIVLIRIIVSSIVGIVLTIVIGRALGTEGKGLYELSIYLPALIVNIIFNFGLPASITYGIARQDTSLATALAATTFMDACLSVLGILFGIIVIYFAGSSWFKNVPFPFLYGTLVFIPMMMFVRDSRAIFRGLQDFRIMGLIDVFQPTVSFIVILLIIIPFKMTVPLALTAIGIGYIVAAIGIVLLLLRRVSDKRAIIPRFEYIYIKQALLYGLQVYGAIIVNNLLLRSDVILLNIWGQGAASIGIYSIAVAMAERVWTFSNFNNAVLMPRIASWKDDKERQGQLTLLNVKYTFWLSVLIASGLVVLGKPFILLTVGKEFAASYGAILMLLPGIIFFNFARQIGSNMIGTGRGRRVTGYVFLAFTSNLLLNLFLIPRYDYLGAGIASSIAYALYGVMMVWDFASYHDLPILSIFMITRDDIRRFASLWEMLRTRLFRKKNT